MKNVLEAATCFNNNNKSIVSVRVSKYKRFNNNYYLCINIFYNVVLSSSNSCQYMMCLLALEAGST